MRVGMFMVAATLAGPVTAQVSVSPGQYQATNVIESMNMPGVPPEVIAMMKGKSTTVKVCITEEDVKRDPKKMMGADKSCGIKRMDISGGKMNSEMVCKTDQGPMTMVMTGTYTATSYQVRSEMRGGMNVISRLEAKRIGDCK